MSSEGMTWAFNQHEVKGNELLTLVVIGDGATTFEGVVRATHATTDEAMDSLCWLAENRYIFVLPGGTYELAMPPAHEPGRPEPGYKRRPVSTRKALAVFDRDHYTCQHCGARKGLTVDHIVPVSKGGTNDPDNLRTLCGPCNSSKGARKEPARSRGAGRRGRVGDHH